VSGYRLQSRPAADESAVASAPLPTPRSPPEFKRVISAWMGQANLITALVSAAPRLDSNWQPFGCLPNALQQRLIRACTAAHCTFKDLRCCVRAPSLRFVSPLGLTPRFPLEKQQSEPTFCIGWGTALCLVPSSERHLRKAPKFLAVAKMAHNRVFGLRPNACAGFQSTDYHFRKPTFRQSGLLLRFRRADSRWKPLPGEHLLSETRSLRRFDYIRQAWPLCRPTFVLTS
jgi:hypothetical protein